LNSSPELNIHSPTLSQSFQAHDLAYFRIVAELWGLDIQFPDTRTAIKQLTAHLLDPEKINEMIELLPAEALAALHELTRNSGRLPWSQFTREYGVVREMGAGRRDREKPYLEPISATEWLWYRALVGRAFFDSPTGPREYVYIPSDLHTLLPFSLEKPSLYFGREASRRERQKSIRTSNLILDHSCTMLAAIRMGYPVESISAQMADWKIPEDNTKIQIIPQTTLYNLLQAAELIDENGQVYPDQTRSFLEASRAEALAQLTRAWLISTEFNELRLVPGFHLEGAWENDPHRTRKELLRILASVPENSWWNLDSFITAIREQLPDFQRANGDFDSWFIRDVETGAYLNGFEHWDDVEGQLIRFIITVLMFWLGIIDLAAPSEDAPIKAFRLSAWSNQLLQGEPPEGLPLEGETIIARSDASLQVPRLAARSARYQIARFCRWEGVKDDVYNYRLTPASLEKAHQQGLQVSHLLAILNKHSAAIPPTLVKALERWEKHGSEARLEQFYVLRLGSAEILKQLRASRAARYLGEPLGPTTIVVKPGARGKVIAALAEMGFLGELKE
jgi:hypothetical protein